MGMTLGLQEAAAKYGIAWPFDFSVMGDITSGQQTWAANSSPPLGYPAQSIIYQTANGYSWQFSIIFDDATHGSVVSIGLTKGNDLIWAASGAGPFDLSQPSLPGIFAGDDTFVGNSAANVFSTEPGNDHFDGGGGTDTVFYALPSTAFTLTHNGSDLSLSNSYYGTDTLTNIERIEFSDESIAFDVQGAAGQAYRLYQAALNRAPDAGGLGFFIETLDAGNSEHTIASNFISSAEFQSSFGANLTSLQYVDVLYQNVLHRAGEASGVAYWQGILDQQLADRAQLLVDFAESAENQANLMGVMQQGMIYTPYVTK